MPPALAPKMDAAFDIYDLTNSEPVSYPLKYLIKSQVADKAPITPEDTIYVLNNFLNEFLAAAPPTSCENIFLATFSYNPLGMNLINQSKTPLNTKYRCLFPKITSANL